MFQNHQLTCNGGPSFFPPNFTWQQIQSQQEENHHQPVVDSISPLLPAAAQFPVNPYGFRGGGPPIFGKRSVSFSGMENCEEVNGEDYLSDEGSQANEKKRRLNIEQVRTLERNFEMGNRLEPERKLQLSRALGLQPRQIAIWFQNRRARWKTKQLEKDYDALKAQFDAIKSENDALHAHNKKLYAEILALRGGETSDPINLDKETEGSTSNRSDNSSDVNLDIMTKATTAAANVTLHPQQSRSFFPSFRPSQLQKSSSENQCPKIEGVAVQEEGFNNMFCNIEDQSAFWSWSEHHNFQ